MSSRLIARLRTASYSPRWSPHLPTLRLISFRRSTHRHQWPSLPISGSFPVVAKMRERKDGQRARVYAPQRLSTKRKKNISLSSMRIENHSSGKLLSRRRATTTTQSVKKSAESAPETSGWASLLLLLLLLLLFSRRRQKNPAAL